MNKSSVLMDIAYPPAMDTELTFGEWLKDQLFLHDEMKQQELADAIGVSQGTVSGWVNNGPPPTETNCDKIADALGINRNEVRRRAGRREVTNIGGGALLELVADLGLDTGARPRTGPRDATAHQPLDIRYIPIIGTAAADTLRASWGAGDLYPVLRSDVQGMGSPVMMVVSGDCMEPRINDGDLVILDTTAEPVVGEVVAVRDGDDVTLKELWSDEGDEIVLRASKAGYPPIRIAKEDQGAQLVGVVRRWIRSGRV